MMTPAFRALKVSAPERRLTLLTSPRGASMAPFLDDIDDVMVHEVPWMKTSGAGSAASHQLSAIERLRAGGFDAAVIFTTYSQSPLPAALLLFLAGIPLRLAHCRENPYQLLTDWVPETEPDHEIRHEVRRQLDLVATIGSRCVDEALSLTVTNALRARVRSILADAGMMPDRPYVVVHPGASAPSRRYPLEGFVEVVHRMMGEDGLDIVLTGDAGEHALVEAVRDGVPGSPVALAGELDLGELCALIAGASLVITNNTAPAHIAAATHTPVVDLYALTNPQHTPWSAQSLVLYHDVPCKYCYKSVCPLGHHDCLRLVAPSAVVDAARSLLPARCGLTA
jgi:lipopolysaccharide heptosyltransferase II